MSVTTSHRPADGTLAGSVRDSTPDEVAATVARAVAAAGEVGSVAPSVRAGWIGAVAQTLDDHARELAALADTETGLGLPRLTGEVARAAAQLRFYASVAVEGSYLGVSIDRAPGDTDGPAALVRVNQPLGPVAVFGASNFPFAFGVLGNDTASALAAGCPVVAKAHPAHALLCARLAELATEALAAAGAPAGTLGMVVGLDAGRVGSVGDALALAEDLGLDPVVPVADGVPAQVRHPVTYSDTPVTAYTAPPRLGQHSDEIRHWLAEETR